MTMKAETEKTEAETHAKETLERSVKSRYHAFPNLLRKGVDGWNSFYDEDSGLLTVPITDVNRAQYPGLEDVATMVVDMHDIRFIGKRAGPPKGVLNKEK